MKKLFSNIKMFNKILICFFLVLAITIIVAIIGIISLTKMEAMVQDLYDSDIVALHYAGEVAVDFQELRYELNKFSNVYELTELSKQQLTERYDDISEKIVSINEGIEELEAVIDSQEILDYIKIIKSGWSSYADVVLEQAAKVVNGGSISPDNQDLFTESGVVLREQFFTLFDMLSESAGVSVNDSTDAVVTSVIMMIAVIVLGVVISVVLGLFLAKIIGGPVKVMAEAANLLAVGDINISKVLNEKRMQYATYKDEIGDFTRAFLELAKSTEEQVLLTEKLESGDLTVNFEIRSDEDKLGKALSDLVANLNTLVSDIVSTAEQLASGSRIVSDSSVSLSQGAAEQASSVEELIASIDEVSTQTALNAQNTMKAEEFANSTLKNAQLGNDRMNEMLRAMNDINVSSNNIISIIKVIEDIAFQTNILALNAAVEAARAGQYGLGFAVVADEVRSLAARSSKAANETTALIEGSLKKVEIGTKIANETATALNNIVEYVEKTAEIVSSIARASNEQATALEQINQGVTQISQIVQTNAATSEESAAASEELSTQAEQLKEAVSIFKIKDAIKSPSSVEVEKPKKNTPKEKKIVSDEVVAAISLGDNDFGKY